LSNFPEKAGTEEGRTVELRFFTAVSYPPIERLEEVGHYF